MEPEIPDGPVITINRLFFCQVCVPASFNDADASAFVAAHNPCGTSGGWHLAGPGDETLGGDNYRQPCEEREGYVHMRFNA